MDTRSNMQGRARALATATRVSESCLGLALLRNHDSEDRAYMDKLRGLEKESRSVQNELEHQRKQFLKRRLGTPGPIIILEQTRAPDPFFSDGDGNGKRGRRPQPRGREAHEVREADGRNRSRPRYMMPTMSRGTVTCSTSTTGAFRISTQTPLDRWNPAALQKVYFRSAVMPSWPLTESDLRELRTTLSRHCWIRKFRDSGQKASAESGSRSNRSKRYNRGAGKVKGQSDEQAERDRQGNGREEELKMPAIDGNQLTDTRGVNVRSRSHSQPAAFESRQMDHSKTKSAEIEQRYQLLPALTDNYQSNVVKRKTKPINKNGSTLSKVQPLLNNEEQFFQTSIEYSIPSDVTDVRNPGNHDDSNNTISSESRTDKTTSASDALPEMTSTRNLLKSLRAVSFSDDVINIGCRTSEIEGA